MCQTPSVYRSEQASDIFPRQIVCQISLQVTIKHAANAFAGQRKKPSNVLTGHTDDVKFFTGHHRACQISLQVTKWRVKRRYRSPQSLSNVFICHHRLYQILHRSQQSVSVFTGHHRVCQTSLQVTTERVKRLYRSPQSVSNLFTGHQRACKTSLQVTRKRVKRLYRSPQTV